MAAEFGGENNSPQGRGACLIRGWAWLPAAGRCLASHRRVWSGAGGGGAGMARLRGNLAPTVQSLVHTS